MRILGTVFLLVVMFLSGCAWPAGSRPGSGAATPSLARGAAVKQNQSSTPSILLVGKVVQVNHSAQFVVLNFPIGRFPSLEQRLNLYRNGARVGEVKVSSWRYDDNVVADIVAGDSQ